MKEENKTIYRVTIKRGKVETVNADRYEVKGDCFSFRKGGEEVALYARDQVESIVKGSEIETRYWR